MEMNGRMQTQMNNSGSEFPVLVFIFNSIFRRLYINNICVICRYMRFIQLNSETCKLNKQINIINLDDNVSDIALATILGKFGMLLPIQINNKSIRRNVIMSHLR